MTLHVGDRVRLTGTGWTQTHITRNRGDIVTITRAGTYNPNEGEFPRSDAPDADPNFCYYVTTEQSSVWAGEVIAQASEPEPDTVFHMGMACYRAGVQSVEELERALRFWVLRDRINEAYRSVRAADTLLRGVAE